MISQHLEKLFRQAQTALQTGAAESAEATCAKALNRHPEDANFLCLSARALTKLGRFDAARARIEQALSIFPDFARAHEAHGELLAAQGELPAAAEAFEQALKIDPSRRQARIKLGRLFMRMGRVERAQALRGEFLKLGEDDRDIAKAARLEKEEKFAEAERIYRQILTRNPGNVSAMRLWARLGIRQRQFAGAEVLLRQAVELAPDFSQAWTDLVTVQYEQQKFEQAIDSANTLIALAPRVANGYLLAASAYAAAGRYPDALAAFDRALSIAPGHVGALCGKGNVCRTIGDQAGAVAAFHASIEADPLYAEAYWNLANLKTFRFEDAELQQMLGLVGNERIPPEGQVQLNNALGLELDRRRQPDRAFEFIDRGNRLRREREFYDRVEHEELIDQLIEVFTQRFLDANHGSGDPDAAPIFIVGLPRSGSTLMEQILSSHSLVDGTHELRDLGLTIKDDKRLGGGGRRYPKAVTNLNKAEFVRLGGEYIERTRRYRAGRPHFTDKNPNNYVHIGLLHLILPNAKIIDARRHPLDSCFGCYKQLFAQGQPFTYDLTELGEHYLQYRRLMEHWREVLPGKVLDVRYEEVVADLAAQVRRILEHCGLPWEDPCLRFHETERAVKSASSEQVRQPIYASAVHSWRRYERHLGPLIEVLAPLLATLPEPDRPAALLGSGNPGWKP